MQRIKSDYFTNKKTQVTFILSILVMTIHSSSFANYSMNSGAGHFLLNIEQFIIALAEVAVPLFFIISGALFFAIIHIKKL